MVPSTVKYTGTVGSTQLEQPGSLANEVAEGNASQGRSGELTSDELGIGVADHENVTQAIESYAAGVRGSISEHGGRTFVLPDHGTIAGQVTRGESPSSVIVAGARTDTAGGAGVDATEGNRDRGQEPAANPLAHGRTAPNAHAGERSKQKFSWTLAVN